MVARLPSPSDGSCPHGFFYNCPESCHNGTLIRDNVKVYRENQETVVRIGPDTGREGRTVSDRIIYDNVNSKIRWGHYRTPEKGCLAMIAMHGEMERLSELDLKRLIAHAVWALRRTKMKHGGYVRYLHSAQPPRDIRLSADIRELFEQLNRKNPEGDPALYVHVDTMSTNPSRLRAYMYMESKKKS